MNKKITCLAIVFMILAVLLNGCLNISTDNGIDEIKKDSWTGYRKFGTSEEEKKIVPHDYVSQTDCSPKTKKSYTIMVYMNGSDLESEYHAATDDLKEMLNSNFDGKIINLLIFTGGTKKWHTKGIPDNINAIYKMENKSLVKLVQLDKSSMAEPEVLSGFINFAYNLFPAENYGLIFWNHGGGAVVGYGSDERYANNPGKAVMKLTDIDVALGNTDLSKENKFEFVGFDTCLMSTLEMACIASEYANYMIASEELEPDSGWDYNFLKDVRGSYDGQRIGQLIIDCYGDFYERMNSQDIITLSMTDLSKMNLVSDVFENFAVAVGNELSEGNYHLISKARSKSRMFGSVGEYSGETDMIDIAHMAESMMKLIPKEAGTLITALRSAVVYQYEKNIDGLGGLSVYFPFANKENLDYNIDVYRSMGKLPQYTDFIDKFRTILSSGTNINYSEIKAVRSNDGTDRVTVALSEEHVQDLTEIRKTTWKRVNNIYIQIADSRNLESDERGNITTTPHTDETFINGYPVCLYELEVTRNTSRYSVPVKLNGEDADLIVVYNQKYPDGKITGAVPCGDNVYNMLDKKIIPLRNGDRIAVIYRFKLFSEDTEDNNKNNGNGELWCTSDEFVINTNLTINRRLAENCEYMYELNLVDIKQNQHFVNLMSIENANSK